VSIFFATAIFVRERRWPQPGWPVRGPWLRHTGHYVKVKLGKGTHYSSLRSLTATGTRVPYGITQCYLPPGRDEYPTFTPDN